MAKEHFTMPTTNNTIKTIITDAAGKEIDSFTFEQQTKMLPDNAISIQKTSYSKIISDGSAYNPAMGSGAHPERLGSCHFCEKASKPRCGPSRSSLLNLRFAIRCYDCLQLACPSHIRRSVDGQFRCSACNIKFRIKRTIKHIFFKIEHSE